MTRFHSSVPPLAAACAAVVLAGCATESDHHYFHKTEQPHAAAWGYTGDTGPSHWGDLCPDYVLAKTGTRQSPIDIRDAAGEALPPIEFDYRPARIDLVYNGHTVEEKEDGTSSVTVGGKRYVLQQFHFHSPSEHTLDGRHTAMEMHLVHKGDGGEVAVVGVMIEEGTRDNAAFAGIWDYLPNAENRTREAEVTIDVAELLPAKHDYYHYSGSFTTPPCTEDVLWMVLRTPVQLSAAQIREFRSVITGNNRPVQPLNARTVTVSR